MQTSKELDVISAPVLILTAADDAVLNCIKNAGHLSPVETPEAVNEEILKFHTSLI